MCGNSILDYNLNNVNYTVALTLNSIGKGATFLIYENVKKIADKKGISISALEREAGIGNGVISGWKESYPRISTLSAVARVLKVKVDYLIRDPGNKNEQ